MVRSILRELKCRGFDRSEYDRIRGSHHVRCSQCEALVINGIACHESGCPNEKGTRDKRQR